MSDKIWKHYLMVLIKGMAMGAADVVPGVSGGTVAFITGIYEELLNSLKRLTPMALPMLWQQGPAAFWSHINGSFLLALGTGILISLLSLARLISYLMADFPVLLWAFFFGLVIASVVYIVRKIANWTWREWVAIIIGTVIAVAISMAKPAQLPAEPWMVFSAGAVAICAMILPGVSGSFILLLMGMYSVFLTALKELNLVLLGSFFGGCILGLLLFSHFLSWLLKRFYDTTLALLVGFLLGSLNVIWPWKHTLETFTNRHGEQVALVQENLLPQAYTQATGLESYTVLALVLAAAGVFLVLGLEYLAKSDTSKIITE